MNDHILFHKHFSTYSMLIIAVGPGNSKVNRAAILTFQNYIVEAGERNLIQLNNIFTHIEGNKLYT